ncbi:MAG: hypothetical protein ACLFR0_08850 [Alphaproteobacteria bacterium]
MPAQKRPMSIDEFCMWRAIFTFALSDGELTLEDQKILATHLGDKTFTKAQMAVLKEDMHRPQKVAWLFLKIKNKAHKKQFWDITMSFSKDKDLRAMHQEQSLSKLNAHKPAKYKDLLKNMEEQESLSEKAAKRYERSSKITGNDQNPYFSTAA